jgi:glycosyltransferase involved in cell wall biosynthesis
MAIQAEKLLTLVSKSGFNIIPVKTNADLPKILSFVSKIKGLRTLLRTILFLNNLHKVLHHVETVYFLTGFLNFFFWVTYPALILAKIHRKRIILNARGGGARIFFRRYGRLVKPILRKVDAISVPSGFLQGVFREALSIETIIVPNIADIEQFRFRERCPAQPSLLITRHLEGMYNVACVVKAFRKIHNHFPQSTLGIVGEGSQRIALEQLVEALGLTDCVTFYGRVEHKEIQAIYDQYDIYVNASDVDNLPGAILEAFASGLPVVSTRAGGIPYLVEDGVSGLLVDLDDHESLAGKVIQLLEQPELALKLARRAREECKKYTWAHVKTVLLPLLEGN